MEKAVIDEFGNSAAYSYNNYSRRGIGVGGRGVVEGQGGGGVLSVGVPENLIYFCFCSRTHRVARCLCLLLC